jgi:phage terminase Nu1 subunit (DNA packaging protein)
MTVVAPKVLKSLEQICKEFGRSRRTVKKWHEQGAPIYKDRRTYGAEVNSLTGWLVRQK